MSPATLAQMQDTAGYFLSSNPPNPTFTYPELFRTLYVRSTMISWPIFANSTSILSRLADA